MQFTTVLRNDCEMVCGVSKLNDPLRVDTTFSRFPSFFVGIQIRTLYDTLSSPTSRLARDKPSFAFPFCFL